MEGHAKSVFSLFVENKCFIVPIYQRPYSWKIEQCRQMFSDILACASGKRDSHFFGSVVRVADGDGALVIDGQQRLTTISLLLLAIKNEVLARNNPGDPEFARDIMKDYLLERRHPLKEDRYRMRLIEADAKVYEKIFEMGTADCESALLVNYRFFVNSIRMCGQPPEEIYQAIEKLMVIDISMQASEKPQLVFESINSTGLDLTEGDKIRNFILMDLSNEDQISCYEKHWRKIGVLTDRGDDKDSVGLFIRDFLTMEENAVPNLDGIYAEFKRYCNESPDWKEDRFSFVGRIHESAECYGFLLHPERIDDADVSWRMFNINRQEVVPAYPFLLRVMSRYRKGTISRDEVCRILEIVDTYVFRRQMCDLPTNSLSKVFKELDNAIQGIGVDAPYSELMAYTLSVRRGNARIPDDKEFENGMISKHVYDMRTKNRAYLFSRLEHGTSKDAPTHKCTDVVWEKIIAKEYTVEHVMPQTLTGEWRAELGENADEVYNTWLHRLANLTLTAYNSELSNKNFGEKSGRSFSALKNDVISYVSSAHHIRLNEYIAQQDHWGEREMMGRANALAQEAVKIWPMPEFHFEPPKVFDYPYSLLENTDSRIFIGMKPVGFTLLGEDFKVTTWREVAHKTCCKIFEFKPVELSALAATEDLVSGLLRHLRTTAVEHGTKIADGLYLEFLGSAWDHCQFLRHLIKTLDVGDLIIRFSEEIEDEE